MISNEKFNRRLKIRRWLKMLIAWPAMLFMCWLTYDQINEVVRLSQLIGSLPKIKVNGVMNNIAPFLGFIIFGFATILPFFMIHPFTESLIKGLFYSASGKITIVIIFFGTISYAFWLDGAIKSEIVEHGYVECLSERQLTLKYSSRTYALSPELCVSE